jgi:hypothetical protein
VKVDKIIRSCSRNGEKTNAYDLLVGKPEGKRPLGRPSRKWMDNITAVLRNIDWGYIGPVP